MGIISSKVRIHTSYSRKVTIQKISLIAQSVLELSCCQIGDTNNADNNDAHTNPAWIIGRVRMYFVVDNKNIYFCIQWSLSKLILAKNDKIFNFLYAFNEFGMTEKKQSEKEIWKGI